MPISTSIEVERPSAEVFAYVTDPARFADWQQGVVGGHMESSVPPAVGDKCVTTRRMGFSNREVVSEVSHVDPPRSWGVCGTEGPVRAQVNVTVEPLENDSRSKVTIEIDFAGHGFGKVLVPLLVRPQAKKEMPANVERLKTRLESA
jgi:hypothetical protein